MNVIRKAVTALGGIFLAALLIAALAPKATRGVAAALVQVTNTAANPVLNQDVDDRDRAPIEFLSCQAFSTVGVEGFQCTPSFTVPADQRFVIDQIDGNCQTPAGSAVSNPVLFLTTGGSGHVANFSLGPEVPNINGSEIYSFNQAVHYVADPGSTVTAAAFTTNASVVSACTFDVSGHLVSFP
jgi:hypothetical protein